MQERSQKIPKATENRTQQCKEGESEVDVNQAVQKDNRNATKEVEVSLLNIRGLVTNKKNKCSFLSEILKK